MGSIYRPWYIFSNFFANLQAQVTVTYADMGRVMIGYSTTQFATQNNAKKKLHEQREIETKSLVKSEVTSHQAGEKSGSN